MTMVAFHALFPEEAENEVRTVTPSGDGSLPPRTFLFVEAYCVEKDCDCRRVMINVVDAEQREQVATINHGFEPPGAGAAVQEQTFLDPLNPQSEVSDAFLGLFEYMIGADAAYRDRLVRHYAMWKRIVDDPSHPAQAKLRDARPGFGILPGGPRAEPIRRTSAKVGRNEDCPCGSGRKFKGAAAGKRVRRNGDRRDARDRRSRIIHGDGEADGGGD